MNNMEIEIKLSVSKMEFDRVLREIRDIAKNVGARHQVDVYYSPAGGTFYNAGDRCLRLRSDDTDSFVSYKQIHEKNNGESYIEEYETAVESSEAIDRILCSLGYWKELVVDKHRQEFLLEDRYLLAFDNVDGLGHFIEIESCASEASSEEGTLGIRLLAERLGLDLRERNTEGYSNLMFKKARMSKE